MDQLKQYIEENKKRFLDELFELIRVPSISARPENKPDMIKMAGMLSDALLEAGADEARLNRLSSGIPILLSRRYVMERYGLVEPMMTKGNFSCTLRHLNLW
jgi:acetylornithine deacetylase/succinyl-diaminopimelate desuccinylase-like protein